MNALFYHMVKDRPDQDWSYLLDLELRLACLEEARAHTAHETMFRAAERGAGTPGAVQARQAMAQAMADRPHKHILWALPLAARVKAMQRYGGAA